MDDDLQVALLPVRRQLRKGRRAGGLLHRAGHGREVHPAGDAAQQHLRPGGAPHLQGHRAGGPGGQGELVGAHPGLPGAQLAHGPGVAVDGRSLVQGRLAGPAVQQLGLPQLSPGRKQAPLLGSILAQGLNGVLQLRQIPSGLGQIGCLPVQQRGIGLVRQVLPGLPQLHAAHVLQAGQQGVPVLGQGDEVEALHLDNSH